MKNDTRQLKDLDGIGRAALKDFELLGVKTVHELSRKNPDRLYEKLASISGPQDICVLDVFRCAVAQAKDPALPIEQRKWWYWSQSWKESDL
ncbi:MAG: hypothetical protein KDD22_00805 [Bdellovibrionales bacterium]|nr:hypothetical protein [Bdellovibrionales bacterium]